MYKTTQGLLQPVGNDPKKIGQLGKKGEFCFPLPAGPELSCSQRRGLLVEAGNKGELNLIQALFNRVTLLSLGLC